MTPWGKWRLFFQGETKKKNSYHLVQKKSQHLHEIPVEILLGYHTPKKICHSQALHRD